MNIIVPVDTIKKLLEEFPNNSSKESLKQDTSYGRSSEKLTIDSDDHQNDVIETLEKTAEKYKSLSGNPYVLEQIKVWKRLNENPDDGAKVSTPEQLAIALKNYISKSKRKWLFRERGGITLPYFVSKIVYHERYNDSPAYTQMELMTTDKSRYESENWSYGISGRSMRDLLAERDYYLENDSFIENYEKEHKKYLEISVQTGALYNGIGNSVSRSSSRWDRRGVSLEREGKPTKLIIDDIDNPEEKIERYEHFTFTKFWTNKKLKKRSRYDSSKDDSEVNEEKYLIPTHPFIICFDTDLHKWLDVHVNNLTPYVYDDKVADKLILPEETKDLVSILIESANEEMEDIIKGKTGGTIIICTGIPGTGKTLTAEVSSEKMKRPLYVVQASQLGLDGEELEKNLKLSLTRATRWGALLLIDEADVYIYQRGTDIEQNAIVGTFLRVLEYYRGILFMTSNRGDLIDDAILSRATAHIGYEIPNNDEAKQIWRVLADQFEIKLKDEIIDSFVDNFPGLVGRDMKRCLKLMRRLGKSQKKEVNLDLLKNVSKFLDVKKAMNVK